MNSQENSEGQLNRKEFFRKGLGVYFKGRSKYGALAAKTANKLLCCIRTTTISR